MQDTELKQLADFLSIAMECIESGSHDVAIDFIEDVAEDVPDERQAADLEGAADHLASGDVDGAYSMVSQVSAELVEEIDDL